MPIAAAGFQGYYYTAPDDNATAVGNSPAVGITDIYDHGNPHVNLYANPYTQPNSHQHIYVHSYIDPYGNFYPDTYRYPYSPPAGAYPSEFHDR